MLGAVKLFWFSSEVLKRDLFFNCELSFFATFIYSGFLIDLLVLRKLVKLARGGGVTPLFGLYGDVPLDRVWFLASLS